MDIAIVFNGPINTPATTKLRTMICSAANRGLDGNTAVPCTKLWLLMNSGGGSLDDGLSLYSLLRTITPEVVTVNMGQIASIANVVFLGGKHRTPAGTSKSPTRGRVKLPHLTAAGRGMITRFDARWQGVRQIP